MVNRGTADLGRQWRRAALVVAVLLAGLGLSASAGCAVGSVGSDSRPASAPLSPGGVATAPESAAPAPDRDGSVLGSGDSGLPVVGFAALPPEARSTLVLIQRGGPFPYSRDGATFGNRERLLPLKPRGYYREYTVPTPGETDRGPRRLVVGSSGERYYTSDHYRSFRKVVP